MNRDYSRSPTYKPCELSKMQTCVPSISGVRETEACPPPPTADDASALPSPTSSPCSISSSSSLFTRCQPTCQLFAVLLYSSRCCAVRSKMLSVFLCFSLYYFCDKYYKPIMVQHYIANCVGLMGKRDLCGLGTRFLFHIIF